MNDQARVRPGISFQSRITAVAMITAVTVLLAACLAFMAEQWRADQENHRAINLGLATFYAHGPSIAAAMRDPEGPGAATVARAAITLIPSVSSAFLLDQTGRVISRAGAATPAEAAAQGLVESRAEIVEDGETRGYLVTYTPPPSMWTLFSRYFGLAGILLLAATGLALALGRWLAGRVTEPVERLSQAMRQVADSGDFAQPVENASGDELGRLTESFNELLAKLHTNDQVLRRTVAELVEARDAAESANRLKSQFLANMSHEIRTPLNGLLAMSQVMSLDDLEPMQQQRLEIIRRSGEALLSILNDVLDVSKIEAGKLELEEEDFDAEDVVRGAWSAFAPVADRKAVAFTLEVAPEAQGMRRGDSARLRQIVNNLVSNALKFTSEGEVRVVLQGDGADGAEGMRLTVSDTGIGIAPDVVPLLFEKFTQADSSTTRRFGGTGLGLAICHELADLMGGRIWVESEIGAGSAFHVHLPLPRTETPVPAALAAGPADAGAEDRPLRVLAAEDNATNQLVLTTLMEIFGVDLTLVGDGRQAVEAWSAGRFDVILMDIQMPEMDGLAATRAIRAAEAESGRARTPIIALSAHAMTHQVKEYLAAGVDMHVPKPIELPKLQAALHGVLVGGGDAGVAVA